MSQGNISNSANIELIKKGLAVKVYRIRYRNVTT